MTTTTPRPARRPLRHATARALTFVLAVGAGLVGVTAPASAVAPYPRVGPHATTLEIDETTAFVVTCPLVPGVTWNGIDWMNSTGSGVRKVQGTVRGDEKDYDVSTRFSRGGEQYLDVTCFTETDGVRSDVATTRVPFTVRTPPAPVVPVTTTTATVSSARVEAYADVELSASVAVDLDVEPVGDVQFLVDGATWGAPAPVAGRTARVTVPRGTLPAGPRRVTATFSGAGFQGSTSAPVDLYVKHSPDVVLTLPSRPTAGPVTLTAAVHASPDAPTPTGEVDVRWSEGARLGTAVLGTDGVARLTVDLAAGTYPDVVAVYRGDESFSDRSSPRATLVVAPAEAPAPTPVVTVALPTTQPAGPLTATVTVAAPTPGGVTPEGGVQLIVLDAQRQLLHASQGVLAGGSATVTSPALPAGGYTVLAHYSGSSVQGVYGQADSAEHALTVTAAPTAPTVPAVTAPAAVSTTVAAPARLTVTLPAAPRPTGDLVVRRAGTGEVLLRTPVPAVGDLALVLPVLAPGTHELVLGTSADGDVAAWRQTVTVTVAGEPARTSPLPDARLTGSTDVVAPDGSITLVARDFRPGETVAFYLHSTPVLLGTAVADAGGVATLVATVPADVATGAHRVVATGGTSGRWAQIAVTVPAAGAAGTATPAAPSAAVARPAAPAATLAATGSGPGLALLTTLALVSGGGLLALRRRLAAR